MSTTRQLCLAASLAAFCHALVEGQDPVDAERYGHHPTLPSSSQPYISFKPDLFTDDGEVTDESTTAFLAAFVREFRDHTERVLTVLPRS